MPPAMVGSAAGTAHPFRAMMRSLPVRLYRKLTLSNQPTAFGEYTS
jgi:hypothetical protein